jgi:NADH dehydrogenase
MVWAAGGAASPLGKQLALSTGCAVDRAGRVVVEPELHVAGFPNISVIRDLAAALSYHPDSPPTQVPGVSPAAKQMGRVAARTHCIGLPKHQQAPFSITIPDSAVTITGMRTSFRVEANTWAITP